MAMRVAFAREGLTWGRERLYRQCFPDETWAHRGAFPQSYVTGLVEGNSKDIHRDRYNVGDVWQKYGKQHSWMFHRITFSGKKGLAVFWERD